MTFTITYGCSLCGGIRKILNSASKLKFQQKCYARVENIHKKPFGLRIANAYYGTTAVTYGKKMRIFIHWLCSQDICPCS